MNIMFQFLINYISMFEQVKCAVVTMAPFPKGNVSTLRYTSYLLSLVKKDIYAMVLVYCPTLMAKHIHSLCGTYKGITYQYTTRATWGKFSPIFIKAFYLFVGLFKSIRYLKLKKINVLILYGENPLVVNLFYFLVCKSLGIRYLGDRSEYPRLSVRKSALKSWVYKKKISLFDGLIIMTKELENYYSQCSKRENFCFLLPMTIDMARFDNLGERHRKEYIAVVFGVHNRDGLYETLLAFNRYVELCGSYDLWLIGNYVSMPNKSILDELISKYHLQNRIKILGQMNIDKVPEILYNASCLITTPNFYISGGFPTKLGEYMLSGTPIVATAAGEIANYIIDKQEMLLAPPGDIEKIAENLIFVEQNPDVVAVMASNAYNKVRKVFSADTYVDNLVKFISDSEESE